MSIYFEMKATKGTELDTAMDEAQKISKILDVWIRLKFNRIEFLIHHDLDNDTNKGETIVDLFIQK